MSNSDRAQLTTANLAAHTAASNVTVPTNDESLRRAALELGFEMPSGWQGSRTYGQRPMERFLNSRDDLYVLSVSTEVEQGEGNQKPNL